MKKKGNGKKGSPTKKYRTRAATEERAMLIRERLMGGDPPEAIRKALKLSVPQWRELLKHLTAHGTDFSEVWPHYIARMEGAMSRLDALRRQAQIDEKRPEERACVNDMAQKAESILKFAIDLGMLDAARNQMDKEAYLGAMARTLLEQMLRHREQAAAAGRRLLEAEKKHNGANGSGNGTSVPIEMEIMEGLGEEDGDDVPDDVDFS